MIEAEEARLKAEIDSIVAKINTTMQNIENVIPKGDSTEETDKENWMDGLSYHLGLLIRLKYFDFFLSGL